MDNYALGISPLMDVIFVDWMQSNERIRLSSRATTDSALFIMMINAVGILILAVSEAEAKMDLYSHVSQGVSPCGSI